MKTFTESPKISVALLTVYPRRGVYTQSIPCEVSSVKLSRVSNQLEIRLEIEPDVFDHVCSDVCLQTAKEPTKERYLRLVSNDVPSVTGIYNRCWQNVCRDIDSPTVTWTLCLSRIFLEENRNPTRMMREFTSKYVKTSDVEPNWHKSMMVPDIRELIYSGNATVVIWGDGSKTIVKKKKGERYSKEIGLAMAIAKKYYGSRSQFLKAVENGKVFE